MWCIRMALIGIYRGICLLETVLPAILYTGFNKGERFFQVFNLSLSRGCHTVQLLAAYGHLIVIKKIKPIYVSWCKNWSKPKRIQHFRSTSFLLRLLKMEWFIDTVRKTIIEDRKNKRLFLTDYSS